MSERRTTEQLLADAEERLRLTADLPAQLDRTRGSATNDTGTVRVAVTVHGALAELALREAALEMGPNQLAQEIVRLAGAATAVALRDGVGLLSRVLGDGATNELAQAVGLGHLVRDAPVIPYVPGKDPNSGAYLPPPRAVVADPHRLGAQPPPADDDPHSFDFSALRSDH